MRKTFVKSVEKAFSESDKAVLFLGDIGVFGFSKLNHSFPERVINVGILEQSMVGIAAGLSMKNFIPTIHTIAPFMVERAFEQIKIDFGYQGLAGNFVSVGASFDYAALGCTHHCPGDVALISTIPNARIYIPGNKEEFSHQYDTHWNDGNLNYFRISEATHSVQLGNFKSGICKIKSGTKATVFAVGPFLSQAMEALNGLDVELYYVNEISPELLAMASGLELNREIVIIEPYYSGTLLNLLVESGAVGHRRLHQIGVPRRFLENYGTYEQHLESLNLDSKCIREKILGVVHG
jgi:transketolase